MSFRYDEKAPRDVLKNARSRFPRVKLLSYWDRPEAEDYDRPTAAQILAVTRGSVSLGGGNLNHSLAKKYGNK